MVKRMEYCKWKVANHMREYKKDATLFDDKFIRASVWKSVSKYYIDDMRKVVR